MRVSAILRLTFVAISGDFTASFSAAAWLSLIATSLASTAFSAPLLASSVSATSWSVTSPMAEQTTTSWFPGENRPARAATCLILFPSATEVPPNFITIFMAYAPRPSSRVFQSGL